MTRIKFTAFELAMLAWETVAVIVYSATLNNANACSNVVIGAVASNQCTPWVFWHTIAVACMWAAALAFVAAIGIGIYNKRVDNRNVPRS